MSAAFRIKLPAQVSFILEKLEQNGFEAFIVGGCVRDSVIDRTPGDWDIATIAKPWEVKAVFDKTIDTGLAHGTVTVLLEGTPYEVTTYRTEGKYINNRKPEKVDFVHSIQEDLSRRDFTINAMAYNDARGLIDPFGGLIDLLNKTIKAVGDPQKRFEEDALRMLRAIRFSAQLGFSVDPFTFKALQDLSVLVKNISAERIRDELNKTLKADPFAFVKLHEGGLLKHMIPELDCCFAIEQRNPYHTYSVAIHSLHAAANTPPDLILRWTMLLHDIGKADTRSIDAKGIHHFYDHSRISVDKSEKIMQRLRFDNFSMLKIKHLILHHDREPGDSEKSVRKAVASIGIDFFEAWLLVKKADIKAQHPDKTAERLVKLDRIEAIYNKIVALNQCLTIKDLAIAGDDLMTIGFSQGKELGNVLKELFDQVLEQPELNNRTTLLELAKKYLEHKNG